MSEKIRMTSRNLKKMKEIQEYVLVHKGIYQSQEELISFCINECLIRAKKKKL